MFHPNSRVLLTSLPDNSGVLLHLDTKCYYSLNESGVILWKRVEGGDPPPNVEELVVALTSVYDVSDDQAKSDVETLVAELVAEGLLETK
ncbi:MAG: hypothetical protein ACI81R_002533 [Bradymonadia bacterium]|jgi:hypothetical protein